MKSNYVVIDVETQRSFDEVGRDFEKLGISVAGIYRSIPDRYEAYVESELSKLNEILSQTDLVVGFNTKCFDYPVLQPYLQIPLQKLNSCDIMDDLKNILGHRVSLNSVAQATLGEGKTGDGLEALRLYKLGEIEKIKKYCLDDVRLTKDVYEFGIKNHFVKFTSKYGDQIKEVKVNWKPVLAQEQMLF